MRSLALVAAILAALLLSSPIIPQCEEDETLIGSGSFDNGRWSAYACGPAVDDYRED